MISGIDAVRFLRNQEDEARYDGLPETAKMFRDVFLLVEKYQKDLAECCCLSGADTDGDEDWRLAERAVGEVRELRKYINKWKR